MESIRKAFHKLNFPPRIKENLELYLKIKNNWKEIFEEFSEKTYPLFIENGVLFIGVCDHYLLQELYHRYLEIMENIKRTLTIEEKEKIKNLKFIYHRSQDLYKNEKTKKKLLSQGEVESLKEFCKILSDKDLFQAFQRVLQALSSHKV